MLAIVVSRADGASEHIGEHLLDLVEWQETTDEDRSDADGGGTVYRHDSAELRTFDDIHLDLDGVEAAFDDPDLLVFASRHAGDTGPLLTAHHTGNFGLAKFGGADRTLARAAPFAHRTVVEALETHAPDGYDVGMECTHHGPTDVGVPSLFVEVGSDQSQWEDPDAARAVARSILDLQGTPADAPPENGTRRHLVGFGGGHYVPRYERVVRETDWAVGHVAADWALDAMGEPAEHSDTVDRAFVESRARYALLEADRPDLRAVVEDLGYRVVGETWVRETSGVALGLVDRIESAIRPIDSGLRFGDRATGYDGEFSIESLSDELLAACSGIDRDATRAAVADIALAFGTEQNGTEVVGPLALADSSDREDIVTALADVLRESFDSVERTGDALVAHETTFDPGLARELGVPEGPKFGKLADGTAIDVDGTRVEPSDVAQERECHFKI